MAGSLGFYLLGQTALPPDSGRQALRRLQGERAGQSQGGPPQALL